MATIEFLKKRVEGARKNVEKLDKKLARILAARDTNWEVNPYYYHEDDIRWTERDLERATNSLHKYEEELAKAEEKAKSRNVKVILDYLDAWKAKLTKFYNERFEAYPEAYNTYHEELKKFDLGYFEERKLKKENYEAWSEYHEAKETLDRHFDNNYGFLAPYVSRTYNFNSGHYDSFKFDDEKLEKDLTEEANRKYDDIIERANAICGEIVDASMLSIGAKGELNGIVVGTRGNARIETIGAGGYNIQCFHFRTLIHEIRQTIPEIKTHDN